MKIITLILPYPPSANIYWRMARGRMILSKQARAYRTSVASLSATEPPFTGDVSVTMRFYRPAKRGDIDNFQKVAIDALRGIAYTDDKQIVELHAFRQDDKHNPRVEIEIEEIG